MTESMMATQTVLCFDRDRNGPGENPIVFPAVEFFFLGNCSRSFVDSLVCVVWKKEKCARFREHCRWLIVPATDYSETCFFYRTLTTVKTNKGVLYTNRHKSIISTLIISLISNNYKNDTFRKKRPILRPCKSSRRRSCGKKLECFGGFFPFIFIILFFILFVQTAFSLPFSWKGTNVIRYDRVVDGFVCCPLCAHAGLSFISTIC